MGYENPMILRVSHEKLVMLFINIEIPMILQIIHENLSLVPRPSLPAFNVARKKREEDLVCNVTNMTHVMVLKFILHTLN